MFVLEPRVMLDGAAALEAVETLNTDSDSLLKELALTAPVTDVSRSTQSTDKTTNTDLSVVTPLASDSDRVELVFIDSRVDLETVDGFASDRIFSISADDDAFAKMADIAANFGSVDAIHVISHGADGELQLGNQTYTSLNIDSYQASLTSLGNALTKSGDLLFYACDLAASEKGVQFIESLSSITGADIAASDDATGIGGDYLLEKSEAVEALALDLSGQLSESLTTETFTKVDISGSINGEVGGQYFPIATDYTGNTGLDIPFDTYQNPSDATEMGSVITPTNGTPVSVSVPNLTGQNTMYALLTNTYGSPPVDNENEYTVSVNFSDGTSASFNAISGTDTRDWNQNAFAEQL